MPTVFEAGKHKSGTEAAEAGQAAQESLKHYAYPDSVIRERPTKHSLSAYMVKPEKIHFETQDLGEKIILLLRRHPITNLGWMTLVAALSLVPLIFAFIPKTGLIPWGYQVVSLVLWYLFVFAFGFERFLSWYYNLYIVTDERVIDVDFHSLLYKKISQAKIDRIEDVTFVMGGLVKTVFNFGTVYIQTAAEQREFDFEEVPHPDRVAKILNELMLEEEQEKIEGRAR